ncbi:hypothetical protein V6N13_043819 [Hibiscus sabdariffa]|uniref:Uncharacterized protein n=1 Tax=Hibiscus sabdariffa TaxID=183260 RepID=A0ABR2RGR2_9ROSI
MRSQSALTGSGAGRRGSRLYGRLLSCRGGGRSGEKRAPAAPIIGAEFGLAKQRWKRSVASMAGLGWTAQVTGVSLRDRGNLWWQLSRAIASTEADASRRSFSHGNSNQRCVWCGTKRLGKIPTGNGWYGGSNINDGGRVLWVY